MRLALRAYYAAVFAALGAYLPYFPAWLEARGIEGVSMSAVSALMPAMGIVGPPLFGLAADALGLRGSLLRVACLGAALPFAAIATATAAGAPLGFTALFGLVGVYAFFRSPMVMMADVVAIERAREHGDAYGSARLWGSLGFLVAAILVGRALDLRQPAPLPAIVAALLAASFVAALLLPARASAPPAPVLGPARRLLAGGSFPAFLTVAFLGQVAHSSYDLCATLHLRDLGASGDFAGVFWAVGVAFEIALMAVSAQLFARFRPEPCLAVGLGAAAIRWLALAFVTSPAVLLALQFLHAFSFGLVWLSALTHIQRRVEPAVASTAQGLFHAAIAVGSVVGMFAWGALYRARGGATVFGSAAVVAACATAAAVAFAARVKPSHRTAGSIAPQS